MSEEYWRNLGRGDRRSCRGSGGVPAQANGQPGRFQALDELPRELGAPDGEERSKLFRLFRPQASTKPLYSMLIAGLRRSSALSRVLHVVLAGLAGFWLHSFVLAGVAGGATWWFVGSPELPLECGDVACYTVWIPITILALIGALAGLAIGIYRCLGKAVVDNGFGLCRGYTKPEAGEGDPMENDELTLWLSRLINRLAGLAPDGPPLTFGQLWNAKGFPPAWLQSTAKRVKSINLQMMTTNVTHGRPYTLPFDDPQARIFFAPEDLEKYLPGSVLTWMVEHAAPYVPQPSDPAQLRIGLFQMPASEDLPVVVAARLSLSFPFLISAVPLYAIDYEAPRGERRFARCWFSDGGISSNFPVHLFDSLLPRWPTFGMKLEGFPRTYTDRIYMPHRNEEGGGDAWNRFDTKAQGFGRFTGFLSAIHDSMMNWNDNTLARSPGYRDRIARIRLKDDEGGMNLNMDEKRITTLSDLGALAANEINSRFVNDAPVLPHNTHMGWENHMWIRLRSLIAILEESVPGLLAAVATPAPGGPSYAAQVAAGMARNPDQYPLVVPAQLTNIQDALKEIADLANIVVRPPDTNSTGPHPLPVLRARPR